LKKPCIFCGSSGENVRRGACASGKCKMRRDWGRLERRRERQRVRSANAYEPAPCKLCGRRSVDGVRRWGYCSDECRSVALTRRCYACGESFRRESFSRAEFDAYYADGAPAYCGRRCANKVNIQKAQAAATGAPRNRQALTRAVPSAWTKRTIRSYREAVTPGLGATARGQLLAKWLAAGVACAYCDATPTTVDHVMPLSRGGTNFEGNLVPCCKACNSSKCDLLLIEWKLSKPHGWTWMDRPWMDAEMPRYTRPRKGSGKPRKVTNPHRFRMLCPCCITPFVPKSKRSTCGSQDCVNEYSARVLRDKYRANNGLEPKGLDYPTKPWMRKHVIPYAASM
jgi:hypothetical protein